MDTHFFMPASYSDRDRNRQIKIEECSSISSRTLTFFLSFHVFIMKIRGQVSSPVCLLMFSPYTRGRLAANRGQVAPQGGNLDWDLAGWLF